MTPKNVSSFVLAVSFVYVESETHNKAPGVINIISEDFLEASNMTSINAPYGVSEFPISGLHPAESRDVKAPRVKESVFSVEAKLVETREYNSRRTGKPTCTMAVIEGLRFWAREDAVNEERNLLDMNVSLKRFNYGLFLEHWPLFRF